MYITIIKILNMEYKNLIYLDVETVGRYKNLEILKKEDPELYELFIRKCDKRYNIPDWNKKPEDLWLEKSRLLAEFNTIVCVSVAYTKDDVPNIKSFIGDESLIITNVKQVFDKLGMNKSFKLSGFNVKWFDLPILVKKMLKYNLNIPSFISFFGKKPWEVNIDDLSEIWRVGSYEFPTLKEVCSELNIKIDRESISEVEVHYTYWNQNNIDKIKKHCEDDITSLIEISKKIYPLI